MDIRSEDFRILSLCTGGGGLDLGVELALPGARTVCRVEREAFAAEAVGAAVAEGCMDEAPLWSDVLTFDGKPWRRRVHCITAGYPCQPFSVAGKRLGKSDPRHLWPEVRRIISEVEPPFVFLENVPGHIVLGLDEVIGALSEIGYDAAWLPVSASEVGASQRRTRLFILAHRRSDGWRSAARGQRREQAQDDRRALDDAQGDPRHGNVTESERGGVGQSEVQNRGECGDVAHVDRLAWSTDGRESDASAVGRHESARTGEAMGDADGARQQRCEQCGACECAEQSPHGPAAEPGLPLFPPGPNDVSGWSRALGLDPMLIPADGNLWLWTVARRNLGLPPVGDAVRRRNGRRGGMARGLDQEAVSAVKSEVRRLADGLANRADQLRLLGNGVVSLQAAYALRTLAAAAGWRLT